MAVTYVSTASAAATTLTMPTHQTNDLLVFFAFNGNGSTTPTVPSGWQTRLSLNGFNRSCVLAWLIATSASTSSGTWTNATHVGCSVYRSDSGKLLFPGVASLSQNAASSVITYPFLERRLSTSDSWVFGASGTEIDTTANSAPAGMTNRTSVSSANGEIGLHDTNANAAWSSNVDVACSSTRFCGVTFEIFESPYTISSGGGAPLIGRGGLVY